MNSQKLQFSASAIITWNDNKISIKDKGSSHIYEGLSNHIFRVVVKRKKMHATVNIYNISHNIDDIISREKDKLTLVSSKILHSCKDYINAIPYHGMYLMRPIKDITLPMDIIFALEARLKGNIDLVMKIVEMHYDLTHIPSKSLALPLYKQYIQHTNITTNHDDIIIVANAINFLLISDGSSLLRYST